MAKQIAQLVVEGKNDRHVVWALCQQHNVPETFTVEVAGSDNKLLKGFPLRLKTPNIRALGIVIDADQNLNGRWQAILNRLRSAGYQNLPETPNPQGTIITNPSKPKVGIWLMPNNQLPGMLEDFVTHLIPKEDQLASKAEQTLTELEDENLPHYQPIHRTKAFIHTWLAWQEIPGQPMGQAITAHSLNGNAELASLFVQWLNKLY